MAELCAFLALALALLALCLWLDESDERRDARRRNQAHPRGRGW